jgi:hypothetical protein
MKPKIALSSTRMPIECSYLSLAGFRICFIAFYVLQRAPGAISG